jgi:RecA/RadA recombinase
MEPAVADDSRYGRTTPSFAHLNCPHPVDQYWYQRLCSWSFCNRPNFWRRALLDRSAVIYLSFGILTIISVESPPSVFDILHPHVVWSALYNSAQRSNEHAVTCEPETRTRVLTEIRSWADSMTTTPICWLSGPAGTGKTTVAHTIAEEYDKRGQLAATFFFWRKTGDRDDINKLVGTLAWQIAKKISSALEPMEEALELKNTSRVPLPELSLEDQLSKLLVRGPVANVNPAGPSLIVIDGLDECASQEGIRRLIDWLRKNEPPFRFLLTSRPEPQIEVCFLPRDGRIDARSLSLTESKDDIRKYFVKKLEEVWPKEQRIKDGGASKWPSKSHLNELVEKSEGLFVYAATAVRYIGRGDSPKMLLEDVLKLHKGLDPLYTQVIEVARKRKYFDIVMGAVMHLRYSLTVNELSAVLLTVNEGLDGPGVRFALAGCHSILDVPGDSSEIKSYHASLRDFLTNQSRSNILFYAPATSHGQLMVACLSSITRAFSDGTHAPEYALVSWYYHACLFLSAYGPSEGLGGLKDEAEELVKKINLKWVKAWMVEAVQWAGVPYLRGQLIQEKVRDWHI